MIAELYELNKIGLIGQEGESFFYEFLSNLPSFIGIFVDMLECGYSVVKILKVLEIDIKA